MKTNKYLSSILRESTPFAILPESLEKFLSLVDKETAFDSLTAMRSVFADSGNDYPDHYETENGVAIIKIRGAIFGEENCATALGMGTANSDIQSAINEALNDPQISGIILDINSPGGEVAGTSDTANLVRQANQTKPVVAYVGDLAASAAYWIASAAGKIILSETASVGSIGVRAVIEDDSEALKMEGLKRYTYLSSQSPKKDFDPKNAEIVADLQLELDYLANIFIESVAKGRNVTPQTVEQTFGQGGIIYGREAVSRRMADQIGTLADALKTLRPNNQTGGKMEIRNTPDLTALRQEAIQAERDRVIAINSLFAQSDEDKAIVQAGIQNGESVGDVALKLLNSQRNKSAALLQKRNADAAEIPAVVSAEAPKAENEDEKRISRIGALVNEFNKKQGVR